MSEGGHPRAATAASIAATAAGFAWFGLTADHRLGHSLFFVLLAVAIVAGLLTSRVAGTLLVSASFLMSILAAAFLGPAAAFLPPVAAELAIWLAERYRPQALAMNLAWAGSRASSPEPSSSTWPATTTSRSASAPCSPASPSAPWRSTSSASA